ncbi:VOC family protein [Larkinella insperata]|uniref:VOC family protein n=1 Tax=Larkinella insperata TaxID=332158 RepID=A0ABW3QE07_9BACT|nr:VOC family protein [Larkinella insperata]
MQKITTFLTFNDQAEQAALLYTSIFKNSRINHISRYGAGAPVPAGTVMSVSFVLDGQAFSALNGGPHFKFAEGISLFVHCETQEEVDEYWEKLTAGGGQPGPCGWLKDSFGVSWQIIPAALGQLLQSGDPGKAQRVLQAMMQMSKIDIAALEQAAEQVTV